MNKPALDYLENVIRRYYGLPDDYLRSIHRRADLVHGRHVFFYVASINAYGNFTQIGKYCKKDHATVMHGKNKIAGRMDVYPGIKRQVLRIMEMSMKRTVTEKEQLYIFADDLTEIQAKKVNQYIKALKDAENRRKDAKISTAGIRQSGSQIQTSV